MVERVDNPSRNPLPQGDGQGIADVIKESLSKLYGSLGQQTMRVNALSKDFNSQSEILIEQNSILGSGFNEMVAAINGLAELFVPISAYYAEQSEGNVTVQPAEPAGSAPPPDSTGKPAAQPAPPKAVEGMSQMLGGIMGGLGGVAAGAGLGVMGAGLTALSGGITVLSAALRLLANPAVVLGGTAFIGFLAGLTGVAFLAGKAIEAIGEGLKDLAIGMDDLAQANVPDTEKILQIAYAMQTLLNSFDAGDAIKMSIADGTMFSDLADGLNKLGAAQFTPEAVENAGIAISKFMDQVGVGDALKTNILTGAPFSQLADGLQKLSDVKLDQSNIEQAGVSLNAFLSEVAGFGAAGGAAVAGMVGDLTGIAAGLKALSDAKVSEANMEAAGNGLKYFLNSIGAGEALEAVMAKAISKESFIAISDGLVALNNAGSQLDQANFEKLREALTTILDAASEDLTTIIGFQTLDDNLIPFATGMGKVNEIGAVIDPVNFQKMAAALTNLLGFSGDIVSMQAIDDNLLPLAAGIEKLNQVSQDTDPAQYTKLKESLLELTKGLTGADGTGGGFLSNIFGGSDDLGSVSTGSFGALGDLADTMLKFREAGELDPKVMQQNMSALQYAVTGLSDENMGEYEKFENFIGIVEDLAAIDPERINGIINTIRELGEQIYSGFKPTAQRLEEQRQRVPQQGSGAVNNNTSSTAVQNTNVNNITNQTNVRMTPPIRPTGNVYT